MVKSQALLTPPCLVADSQVGENLKFQLEVSENKNGFFFPHSNPRTPVNSIRSLVGSITSLSANVYVLNRKEAHNISEMGEKKARKQCVQ